MAKKNLTLFEKLKEERSNQQTYEAKSLRYSLQIKILIILTTVLFCSLFFTIHIDYFAKETISNSVKPGYIWPGKKVIAEYSFPIYKDFQELAQEKKSAINNTSLAFKYNKLAAQDAQKTLTNLCNRLRFFTASETQDLSYAPFPEEDIQEYLKLEKAEQNTFVNRFERDAKKFLKEVYESGLANISKEKITSELINIHLNKKEITTIQATNIYDMGLLAESADSYFGSKFPDETINLINFIINKSSYPNIMYSDELTNISKNLAESSVKSTLGIVRKGEVIVEKSDIITELQYLKLKSYKKSNYIKSDKILSVWILIGSAGHVFVIYFILILYLFFLRKKIFYDNVKFGILSTSIILIAFEAWLSLQIGESKFHFQYLITLPAFTMLIAVVFDSRTAFYMTVTMALMIAGIRGSDYETSVSMIFAGLLASYTVRDIQSRTQMYKSIFFISIGLIIPIIFFGLERSNNSDVIMYKVITSIINAVFSPIITFGLIFILERISNIATDLRIKEYDNINHELLQKLNEQAPGTYQHTMQVALVAENCARAINANPLLARVGTYFHDIGKISKPEYFVENQIEGENKHDLLSPKKSCDAIKAHVKAGIQMGLQYKLPQRIVDFIPMHHGTTLIRHFYAKALELADQDSVNKDDYRYPGPKPKNKETAIVMIADTAEAMSRLLASDPEKFKNALQQVIEDRIIDGQFDDCDLTFNELKEIKEVCVKTLTGVSHHRVAYKEVPKEKDAD